MWLVILVVDLSILYILPKSTLQRGESTKTLGRTTMVTLDLLVVRIRKFLLVAFLFRLVSRLEDNSK